MKYMNEFDIHMAKRQFMCGYTPYRAALVFTVIELRDWTDLNSDGWAYWRKPLQAAQRAISHIESGTYEEDIRRAREDISLEEFKAAIRPIKSFLTRQNVSDADRKLILSAVDEVVGKRGVKA